MTSSAAYRYPGLVPVYKHVIETCARVHGVEVEHIYNGKHTADVIRCKQQAIILLLASNNTIPNVAKYLNISRSTVYYSARKVLIELNIYREVRMQLIQLCGELLIDFNRVKNMHV
jgi:transcriptional antiterminator